MKPPSQAKLLKQIADWNDRVRVGDMVKYFPVIGGATFTPYETSSTAYILSGHTAVLHLKGKSGCVAVDACEPLGTSNASEQIPQSPAGGKKA